MSEEENKVSIKKKLRDVIDEVRGVGGWTTFRSGEWLFHLIQKSFRSYWKNANVEYFRNKYSMGDDEFIANKLIKVAAHNSALVGAATGLVVSADEIVAIATVGEGVVGLPANVALALTSMTAEAVLLVRFQLQLVANLGKLYEVPLDPDDPEDILNILAYAVGGSVAEIAGKMGMKIGSKLTEDVVKKYISKGMLNAFKRLGTKLGADILQKSIMKYTVPLLSIGMGYGWNYLSTRAVGKIAKKHFRQRQIDFKKNEVLIN